MISVYDHFSHGDGGSYDFIAMGTIMKGNYDGIVITNFGSAYFKNSPAGKALAERALLYLNSKWKAAYPDQDYVTKALFDGGNFTQVPLPALEKLGEEHRSDELCKTLPKTCTWLATGVHGDYYSGGTAGHYMFLPQVVAPRECSRLCSGATTLFQHCGMSYCLPGAMEAHGVPATDAVPNLPCRKIPEYILRDMDIHKEIMSEVPPAGFKPDRNVVWDSRAQQHIIKAVAKFIDHSRVQNLCRAYPSVCTATPGKGDFGIMVH